MQMSEVIRVQARKSEGLSLSQPMSETQAQEQSQATFSLPPTDETCKPTVWIQAYADAAVSGESKSTGIGYWARRQGELLLSGAITLPAAVSTVTSELMACYLLLRELDQQGLRREPITLYVDNAVVVSWLRWWARPKQAELRKAVAETKKLAKKFKCLRIHYLAREKNRRAHRLARRAMRGEGSPWQR
jgi:ribonuclease HI